MLRYLSLVTVVLLFSSCTSKKEAKKTSTVVEKHSEKTVKAKVISTPDLDESNQDRTPTISAKGSIYVRGEEQKLSYLITQAKGSKVFVSSSVISEIDGVSYRKLTLSPSGMELKARLHKKHKSGKTEVRLTLNLKEKSVTETLKLLSKHLWSTLS